MATNIPMDEVEKIVYNHPTLGEVEPNTFKVDELEWKKYYTLDLSGVRTAGISFIIRRCTRSNCDPASLWTSFSNSIPSNSLPIRYDDELEIEATGATGYNTPWIGLDDRGGERQESYSGYLVQNVRGDCSLEIQPGAMTPYTLTISKGTGVASVTVRRDSSWNSSATIGVLASGATIYYADFLIVTATASSGYTLDTYTTRVSVSGNTTVRVTATAIPYEWRTVYSGRETINIAASGSAYTSGRSKKTALTEDDFGVSLNVAYPIRISGTIRGAHAGESFESTFTNVELCDLGEPAVLGTHNTGGTTYYVYETTAYAETQDPEAYPSWTINVTRYISRVSSLSNNWSADFPEVAITKIDAYMPAIISGGSGGPGSSQTLALSSGAQVVVGTGIDSAGDDWYWYNVSSDLDIHCICRGSHWGYNQVPLQYGPGYTNDPIDIYEFDGYNSSEMLDAAGNSALEAQIVAEYGTYLGSIQLIDGYWYIV